MHIDKLELYATDLSALHRFYGGLLGLKSELSPPQLHITLPSTELMFTSVDSVDLPGYHFAFNISENKIKDSLGWLESLNINVVPNPSTDSEIVDFQNWCAHSVYFLDPGGNIVEFIARHELDNADNGAFGPQMILSVSEIGVPVADVRLAYEAIHMAMGSDRYSGNFSTFCPIGNAHGLLIVTGLGRNWFPTDIPSLPAPFRAVLSNGARRKTLTFDGEHFEFAPADTPNRPNEHPKS